MQGIVMEGRGGAGVKALLWAGFGPLLGTLSVLGGFVLWPTENVFLHPDHWYECMLQCGVFPMGEWHYNLQDVNHDSTDSTCFWLGTYALFLLANTAAWLGTPRLLNRHAYLACFLSGFTIMMGYWILLYLVWTQLLGLPYPIPLIGAQASALWLDQYKSKYQSLLTLANFCVKFSLQKDNFYFTLLAKNLLMILVFQMFQGLVALCLTLSAWL